MRRSREDEDPPEDAEVPAPFAARFIQTFARSQTIFDENAPGSEMYVVSSGKVNLYKEREGRRVLLATMVAGDFFGEMALVDGSPRSATAIAALHNTRLVALDRAKFLYLLRHQPEFALMIMGRLCDRLRQSTELASATLGRRRRSPAGR